MRENKSAELAPKKRKIIFFGNFGTGNFGNEGTLQAIYFNLRHLMPEAEFGCICTYPQAAAAIHNITALPISRPVITAWTPKNRMARFLRSVVLGIPSELYRWYEGYSALKGTDALIVPGTGLLTDTHDLLSWGPYGLLKWSVLAKLRGCKLFFVSVGVGPLYGRLGRRFAKSALGLADFRSYRDASSLEYLKEIGFTRTNDRVYPDLAFSLPEFVIPRDGQRRRRRPVVGLGLMKHVGMYGDDKPDSAAYQGYLESLATLVKWLLERNYDIRLLIGELGDPVTEFRRLLDERLPGYDSGRVMDAPVTSVEELFSQFADTDFVIVTRFHNILFALLSNKPTVSIAFHHKCTSLMAAMGLSEYCIRIDECKMDNLIQIIIDIEKNSDKLKPLIAERIKVLREALKKQYGFIVTQQN